MRPEDEKKEIRYIVRIAGKDVDGKKPIFAALMGIKGISHRFARVAAMQFEKETGVKFDSKIGEIEEEHDKHEENCPRSLPEDYGRCLFALGSEGRFDHGPQGEKYKEDCST